MTNTIPAGPEQKTKWMRTALWLVGATMAYNVIEAGVAIASGIAAGSIALVGFGLDSVIELAAATVLLWRLSVEAKGADEERIESTERKVLRFVGITFFLLAAYVIASAGLTLFAGKAPEESMIGIVLAVASLIIMPVVAWGKLRTADRLESESLRAEAKETLACSYLSFTLLLGLTLHAALGWWWADPVAAMLMTPWLIREGMEALEGDDD